MVAAMRLLALDLTSIAPAALIALSSTLATVPPRMMFIADAPAPLTPTPAVPPTAAASAAAMDVTSMLAADLAITFRSPLAASRAPAISASTWVAITLRAKDTPIDTATPALLPNAAAIAAAPAKAWIRELSRASMSTLRTEMSLKRWPIV